MVVSDEIFLLHGGKTRFILRRRKYSNEANSVPQYEIVGDCYLDGWMNGATEVGSLEWIDIELV